MSDLDTKKYYAQSGSLKWDWKLIDCNKIPQSYFWTMKHMYGEIRTRIEVLEFSIFAQKLHFCNFYFFLLDFFFRSFRNSTQFEVPLTICAKVCDVNKQIYFQGKRFFLVNNLKIVNTYSTRNLVILCTTPFHTELKTII